MVTSQPVAAAPVNAAATVGTNGSRRVPASILDLAEAVNDDERHHGNGNGNGNGNGGGAGTIDLVDDGHEAPGAPAPQSRFASILESLAHEEDAPPATRRRSSRGGIATEVRDRMSEQAESARRTATAARISSD